MITRPLAHLASLLLLAFSATSQAGLIGNPLVDRPSRDGANGALFMITTDTDSGVLDTFGFFDNTAPGRQITPVILRANGTGYEITGIGTTRTSDGSGSQSASFGLQSGSANFGLGHALGWRDGSPSAANQGVAEFTNNGPGRLHYFGIKTGIALNDSYTAPQNFAREYSVNGTVSGSGTEIVGSTLTARPNSDTVSGAIFVLNDAISGSGSVQQWSMFDANDSGQSITPLLLRLNGVNWEILGQGTTRVSDGSGAQLFDFDLVAGSDAVDPSIRFGWKDGANGADNQGVADWDGIAGGQETIYLGAGRTSTNIGETFAVTGTFDRTYSIEALAIVVPEPGTLALFLAGSVSLMAVRQRRNRRGN